MNNCDQTVNPSVTPVQNPVPEHPVKNQKGLFPIILGVIVLVLVVGGAVYYLGIQKNQPSTPTNQAQNTVPTVSSQNSPIPTVSPAPLTKLSDAWTLGTKTSTSPKINITFEYPSYFETKETDIQKENKEWADKYKNDPNVRQPRYRSNFYASFSTPNQELATNQEFCDNKISVSVQQYDNPQNMTLYDFIADLNKSYPGDGRTEPFETYKKNLIQSQLPKVGSYVFEGIIGEDPVKEVYFTHNNKVYEFHLIGNCDTGGQYTPDAEAVFDNMLKSIKYL